jgi:hypothetical protein
MQVKTTLPSVDTHRHSGWIEGAWAPERVGARGILDISTTGIDTVAEMLGVLLKHQSQVCASLPVAGIYKRQQEDAIHD